MNSFQPESDESCKGFTMAIDFLLGVFRRITQRAFHDFSLHFFLSCHVCIEQPLTITYRLPWLWF
jgi:hypothetical protein